MASNAIEGIKIKIGADLSDLKKELGLVDDTVKDNIDPARKEVKGLSRDFNDAATKARKISINVQEVAAVAVKLGSALTGFTKGLIEEAVKVDPDTAANVEAVKESFASIKQSIVGAIIPLIETWGPKLTALFQSIAQWINDNPETAEGLFKVSAAVGGIAVAAGTALPIVVQLQFALAGVSATALGIAGVVVGAIAILAILSSTLDDISAKASQTAEEIANMDTTTQKIVENGIGELSVENRDDYDWVANVWDPVKKEFVEGWAYFDENIRDYVLVSEEVATAASETASAIAETTAATDTAKTASEEATDILTGLQQSMESLGAATQEIDLTEINSMLESEAFRQLASEPISEDVSESWTAFGEAVTSASAGFSSIETSVAEESPLILGLTNITAVLDKTKTSAESLGGYLSGEFVTAINTLLTFLCMTTTDEEGNTSAGGGNTLYNALGSIYGLFEDIYATSQLLAAYWTNTFISASVSMRTEAGHATGVLQGLGTAAQGAAEHFYALAAQIYGVIDAYLALQRVKGGGGGGNGGSTDMFKASGGPVSAGSPYVVGELGPEIFVPSTSGTIIPNDRVSAGGPTVNVIFQGQVIGDERTISAYVTKACNKAIKEAVHAGA